MAPEVDAHKVVVLIMVAVGCGRKIMVTLPSLRQPCLRLGEILGDC